MKLCQYHVWIEESEIFSDLVSDLESVQFKSQRDLSGIVLATIVWVIIGLPRLLARLWVGKEECSIGRRLAKNEEMELMCS